MRASLCWIPPLQALLHLMVRDEGRGCEDYCPLGGALGRGFVDFAEVRPSCPWSRPGGDEEARRPLALAPRGFLANSPAWTRCQKRTISSVKMNSRPSRLKVTTFPSCRYRYPVDLDKPTFFRVRWPECNRSWKNPLRI